MIKIRDQRDKNVPKPKPLILQHSASNRVLQPSHLYSNGANRNNNRLLNQPSFQWTKTLDTSVLELYSRFGPQWNLIMQMLPPYAIKNRAALTSELVKRRFKDLQSKKIAKQVIEFNFIQAQLNPKINFLQQYHQQNQQQQIIKKDFDSMSPLAIEKNSMGTASSDDHASATATNSNNAIVNDENRAPEKSSIASKKPHQSVPVSANEVQASSQEDFAQPQMISSNQTSSSQQMLAVDDVDLAIQTPTKAIAESERLSFHLVSPPIFLKDRANGVSTATEMELFELRTSPLLSWGRAIKMPCSGNSKRQQTGFVSQPSSKRMKQVNLSHSMQSGTRPTITIPKNSVYSNAASRKLVPAVCTPIKLTEGSTHSSLVDTEESGGQLLDNNVADSIAMNAAKVTVINRLLVQEKERELKQKFEARLAKRQLINLTSQALTPGENTVPELPIEMETQPHLAIRRTLQIGFEDAWQTMSFGGADDYLSLLELAQSRLQIRLEDSSSSDEIEDCVSVAVNV